MVSMKLTDTKVLQEEAEQRLQDENEVCSNKSQIYPLIN